MSVHLSDDQFQSISRGLTRWQRFKLLLALKLLPDASTVALISVAYYAKREETSRERAARVMDGREGVEFKLSKVPRVAPAVVLSAPMEGLEEFDEPTQVEEPVGQMKVGSPVPGERSVTKKF